MQSNNDEARGLAAGAPLAAGLAPIAGQPIVVQQAPTLGQSEEEKRKGLRNQFMRKLMMFAGLALLSLAVRSMVEWDTVAKVRKMVRLAEDAGTFDSHGHEASDSIHPTLAVLRSVGNGLFSMLLFVGIGVAAMRTDNKCIQCCFSCWSGCTACCAVFGLLATMAYVCVVPVATTMGARGIEACDMSKYEQCNGKAATDCLLCWDKSHFEDHHHHRHAHETVEQWSARVGKGSDGATLQQAAATPVSAPATTMVVSDFEPVSSTGAHTASSPATDQQISAAVASNPVGMSMVSRRQLRRGFEHDSDEERMLDRRDDHWHDKTGKQWPDLWDEKTQQQCKADTNPFKSTPMPDGCIILATVYLNCPNDEAFPRFGQHIGMRDASLMIAWIANRRAPDSFADCNGDNAETRYRMQAMNRVAHEVLPAVERRLMLLLILLIGLQVPMLVIACQLASLARQLYKSPPPPGYATLPAGGYVVTAAPQSASQFTTATVQYANAQPVAQQ